MNKSAPIAFQRLFVGILLGAAACLPAASSGSEPPSGREKTESAKAQQTTASSRSVAAGDHSDTAHGAVPNVGAVHATAPTGRAPAVARPGVSPPTGMVAG